MGFSICRTCAVEHTEAVGVCRICADERQWVPAEGQQWTTLDELAAAGQRLDMSRAGAGPVLHHERPAGRHRSARQAGPHAGGQPAVGPDRLPGRRDRSGSASWARSSRSWRATRTCSGCRWSGAGRSVAPRCWSPSGTWTGSAAPDPVIRPWSGKVELLPGVTLTSRAATSPAARSRTGRRGPRRGVLLSRRHDLPNPDRTSVSFMRSYPNRIPLSGAVVERIAGGRGLRVRPALRQLRREDRLRRPGGRAPLGRPAHRLGPGRLRPPDLVSCARVR